MKVINNKWNKDKLWKGCITSSIAHAIMNIKYPEFAFEHSWDGTTYSVQDGISIRASISFSETYCIGCIRDEKSKRLLNIEKNNYINHFKNAPNDFLKVAEEGVLKYLLEDVDGIIKPVITTAFWCNDQGMFSNDRISDINKNGAKIFQIQLSDQEEQIGQLVEYYEMNLSEVQLLKELVNKKIENPNQIIYVSKNRISKVETDYIEGMEQARISFEEIGIILQ